MLLKCALYSASKEILIQAQREFVESAVSVKLSLQMAFYQRFANLAHNLRNHDIIAIHENEFYTLLPDITALAKEITHAVTVQKAKLVIGMFTVPIKLNEFLLLTEQLDKQNYFIDIPISKGYKSENVNNVIYFENINRRIHLKTAFESYPTRLTMKEAYELTDPFPFASPYVSFLINLDWVQQITRRDILLKNQDTIPLSQKKAAQFRQIYMKHMSKTQ